MNKSVILVTVLTLGVLLIVAGLFIVSAGQPLHSGFVPGKAHQAVNCEEHKPTGNCDPEKQAEKSICKDISGGACIYNCKADGTYDDGAACTSGQCHDADSCEL